MALAFKRALHRPLERPRRAGHVAGGGDHRPLPQRGRVGAGQPDAQLGRDFDVDQAGHAARAEQGALAAGFPDDAGVDHRARLDGLERVDLDPGGQVGLRLDHALVADHRAFLDPGGRHHVGVLADDAAAQGDPLPDVDVVVHHRPVQERAFLDHHVAAQHGELAQFGARLHLGVVADADRPGQHRLRVHLGALGHPYPGRHLEPVDIGVHPAGQHVGLDLQVALVGAHVFPVAVGDVAEQRRAPLEQGREHVSGPVHRLPRRDLGQHLGLHHVDPGVDRVREHLPPGGLLQEALDPAVLADDDDAELQRVGHPGQPDGDQRPALLVRPDHGGQVDVGQRVAGDDQERLVAQRVLGVLHAARGAERRLLGGVLQAHAHVLAVPEVVAHQRGQELHGDHGLVEAVPLEQPEHVFHDRLVADGQQRLGLVGGHWPQPGALSARHHDGLHRCRVSFQASRAGCLHHDRPVAGPAHCYRVPRSYRLGRPLPA